MGGRCEERHKMNWGWMQRKEGRKEGKRRRIEQGCEINNHIYV
jgi:hypothetical protein